MKVGGIPSDYVIGFYGPQQDDFFLLWAKMKCTKRYGTDSCRYQYKEIKVPGAELNQESSSTFYLNHLHTENRELSNLPIFPPKTISSFLFPSILRLREAWVYISHSPKQQMRIPWPKLKKSPIILPLDGSCLKNSSRTRWQSRTVLQMID